MGGCFYGVIECLDGVSDVIKSNASRVSSHGFKVGGGFSGVECHVSRWVGFNGNVSRWSHHIDELNGVIECFKVGGMSSH